MRMLVALSVAVASALSSGRLANQGAGVADITITFADPVVKPPIDLPADARRAGFEPADSTAARTGSAAIQFNTVRDPSSHGALSTIVAGKIAALNVTWADDQLFKSNDDTREFLRRLLSSSAGSTSRFVVWSQLLGVPSVAATVEHTVGKPGTWLVWYAWPSIYCGYRDGDGGWWFGTWFQVEGLRLRSPAAAAQYRVPAQGRVVVPASVIAALRTRRYVDTR